MIAQRRTVWFDWTVALTLVITNLVLTRTATPHYAAFLFIFVYYFRLIARRRNGTRWVLAAMLLLNVALWLLFIATVSGNIEAPVVQLPLPIVLLITLLLTRRLWRSASPLSSEAAPAPAAIPDSSAKVAAHVR